MANTVTAKVASTHEERQNLVESAKSADIFEVAQQLGLKPLGSDMFDWNGHQSIWLDRRKNRFQWFAENVWGGPIDLANLVLYNARTLEEKRVHFKEVVSYLTQTEMKAFDVNKVPKPQPFRYFLNDSPKMDLAEAYLVNERGLTLETVRFFEYQGVLAQADWQNRLPDGGTFSEPVVVFKHFDHKHKLLGASVQGIGYYPELHADHASGHLKRVMKNSGAYGGLAIDIGTPKRIVVCEAPIDLMSYYELHKDELHDVKLISSDGYKPHVLSRYVAEIYGGTDLELVKKEQFLAQLDDLKENLNGVPNDLITFAYDNDEAGRSFVEMFKAQFPHAESYTQTDFPPLASGQAKNDWNDELKKQKGQTKMNETQNGVTTEFEVLPLQEQAYLEQRERAATELQAGNEGVESEKLRELGWDLTNAEQNKLEALYSQLSEQKLTVQEFLNKDKPDREAPEVVPKQQDETSEQSQATEAVKEVEQLATSLTEELPQQVEQAQQEARVFLTKEELDSLLSAHFEKLEGVVNQFKEDILSQSSLTPQVAQQEVKSFGAQIRDLIHQMVEQVKNALLTKTTMTRISMTNTLKTPLLQLGEEIKAVGQSMEQRFALEKIPNASESKAENTQKRSKAELVKALAEKEAELEKLKSQVKKSPSKRKDTPAETFKVGSRKTKPQNNFEKKLQAAKVAEKEKLKQAAGQNNTVAEGKRVSV